MSGSAPPQHVFEMPRVARPEAAKIVFDSPGFTSIEPTPRAEKASAPSGPFQPLPPLWETYSPTPTSHPLEHAFGSPVPAQIVWCDASLGSSSSDDVFCWSNVPERNSHVGSPASALSVFQTPPFVAAMYSVQRAAVQSG